jgi:1,2-diacylglycerol 3-beta-galactosyltransferase
MGPIEEFAAAINKNCPHVSLAVITGRNKHLKTRLENYKWNIPAYIYGFVNNMPSLMQAADILASKAGPGTISEALICQLPIILYSYMPGQEDGNIDYVVEEGVGHWAPETKKFVAVINQWVENPQSLAAARRACLRLARPDAAMEIAAELTRRAVKIHQAQQS